MITITVDLDGTVPGDGLKDRLRAVLADDLFDTLPADLEDHDRIEVVYVNRGEG